MSHDVVQNQYSSIDWDLSVKLAGNNRKLAREILTLFTSTLGDEMNTIIAAKSRFEMDEVLRLIHKLHGAASYCGVPRLKEILADCEALLKRKKFVEFNAHFSELMLEVEKVSNHVERII